MIITIDRQAGCHGTEMAQRVADYYGIPLVREKELRSKAEEAGVFDSVASFFEERPVDSLLYSVAIHGGFPKNQREAAEQMRALLRGQSFVMVGRCGNYLFEKEPDSVSVFIHARHLDRVNSIMRKEELTEKLAREKVKKIEERRAEFYRHHTGRIWGMAEDYDLSVNASIFGIEATAKLITAFVDACHLK